MEHNACLDCDILAPYCGKFFNVFENIPEEIECVHWRCVSS